MHGSVFPWPALIFLPLKRALSWPPSKPTWNTQEQFGRHNCNLRLPKQDAWSPSNVHQVSLAAARHKSAFSIQLSAPGLFAFRFWLLTSDPRLCFFCCRRSALAGNLPAPVDGLVTCNLSLLPVATAGHSGDKKVGPPSLLFHNRKTFLLWRSFLLDIRRVYCHIDPSVTALPVLSCCPNMTSPAKTGNRIRFISGTFLRKYYNCAQRLQ